MRGRGAIFVVIVIEYYFCLKCPSLVTRIRPRIIYMYIYIYRSTDISVDRYFSRYLSILPLSVKKKKRFFLFSFFSHIHNYTEYNQQ